MGLEAPGQAWWMDKENGLLAGKGPWQSVQAGKEEGLRSGQRSPRVWSMKVEGVKLRWACERFPERRESPQRGAQSGSGRGAEVKVGGRRGCLGTVTAMWCGGGKKVELLSWFLVSMSVPEAGRCR